MFQNVFSFKGRIRRTEYGISCIGYVIFIAIVNRALVLSPESTYLGIFYFPLLWLILSQGAKRCHDLGNSGWFQIIPFYILWMLFDESKYGQNVYGINPKGIGNPEVTNTADV